MAVLKNRVGVATATTGTGPVTLGAALGAVAPNAASWQTFVAGGVLDGDHVRYLILDSNGAWEYGDGTYQASGTLLFRATGSMNGSIAGQKSSTGALLSLTGTAQIFITAIVEDLAIGNVRVSGTPTMGQLAMWLDGNTIQEAGVTYAPIASPTFTGVPAAPTPTAGDNSTKLATTQFVKAAVTHPAPAHGRLSFVSATQIKFEPYNGNKIQIAGVLYDIPAAGITANNTGVYVNGVAGQNLTPGSYYVCVFNNAGTPTIDFVNTGRATDTTAGNVGVQIKSGDPSRSVVGMIMTNLSSQFQDTAAFRGILNWFNRRVTSIQGSGSPGTPPITASGHIEISAAHRAQFMMWINEVIYAGVSGGYTVNSPGTCSGGLGFNGVTNVINSISYQTVGTAGWWGMIAGGAWCTAPFDGGHYISLLGQAPGIVGNFYANVWALGWQ